MHTIDSIYIGFGSNLSEPVRQIQQAISTLNRMPTVTVRACSSLYRTSPVGYVDQPDFVNGVCAIETFLTPPDLLQVLLSIEQQQGRVRGVEKNGPRIIDLDILLYGQYIYRQPDLVIPHPQLYCRAFALQPLCEIAPDITIPGYGNINQLMANCVNQGVTRITGQTIELDEALPV